MTKSVRSVGLGLVQIVVAAVLTFCGTARAAIYTWTNTTGGAQTWETGSNWSGGIAPSPTTGDTVDFSTRDMLADTVLTLGADRTAYIWKFGDSSGEQNWTVNSGNTMILPPSYPYITVLQNTVTLNNDVDFTAAGFYKDGPGTLVLASPNPASGVIRVIGGGQLILDGSQVTNGAMHIGSGVGQVNNSLLITNGAQVTSAIADYGWTARIGANSSCVSNSVTIAGANGTTNSVWNLGGSQLAIGYYNNCKGNWVKVSGGGVLTNASLVHVGTYLTGTVGNYLIVTNGGRVYGGVAVGSGGAGSNWVYVGSSSENPSLLNGAGSSLRIGGNGANASSDNRMTVDRGGLVTNVNAVYVGAVGASSGNSLLVDGGGQLISSGNVMVGTSTTASSNTVALTGGGLLECSGITLGASGMTTGGNTVTNSGGILQFTTAAPTIANYNADAAASRVAIDSGTVSYRLSTGAVNLTNNWGGAGIGGSNIAWSGNNTLRLNDSTATSTLAAGYTFANNLGSTNYTRLELVNGTNVLTGTGITIDGTHGGSLMLSNTVAIFQGGLTLTSGAVVDCGVRADGTSDLIEITGGAFALEDGVTFNLSVPADAPPATYALMDWSRAQSSAISPSGITVNCSRPCSVFVWGDQLVLGVPEATYLILK